jgi:hypothetical protein
MIKFLKKLFRKKYKPVDFSMFDCKKSKGEKKKSDIEYIYGHKVFKK